MTPGPPEEGVFVRMYYPSQYSQDATLKMHDQWPLWSDDDYLLGFVKFMQAMLAKWPSWAPRGEFLFIDQISYIAPLMHLGCTHVWKILNGRVYCPILKNAPISNEKKWPLVVFSHGMGCSRFAYSRICTDIASHGFVVAAVEHRDGSAALSYSMESGNKLWIQHRRITDEDKEYQMRNSQLQFRIKEVVRVLNLVEELARGSNVTNVLEDAGDYDLKMFKDKIDTNHTMLTGHSYGGATTLMTLARDERFKLGVVLDGWLFPMKDEKVFPKQPILFVNTESFMSRHNIQKMKLFLEKEESDPCQRKMIFIKGSVHQNHIDAPLIFKDGIIKKIIGMQSDTDPMLVLDINNKLMLHFMLSHIGQNTGNLAEFLVKHENILIEAGKDEEPDVETEN